MAPLDLQLKAESWLHTLGCTPVPQEDPQASWHFIVDYPVRSPHQMHVVGPKACPTGLVIATATTISREHFQVFETLDEDDRAEFLWELRRTLNHTEVDFKLEGVKETLDCPTLFQVSVTRFADALTNLMMAALAADSTSGRQVRARAARLLRHLATAGSGSRRLAFPLPADYPDSQRRCPPTAAVEQRRIPSASRPKSSREHRLAPSSDGQSC